MVYIVFIGLLFIVVVIMYNKLVRLRLMVKEGFSGIDVQLKRRHNLIPNIVETVKGYSQHEQGLFEKVTELRSQLSGSKFNEKLLDGENQLSASLRNIFVLAEAYPELKADKNFLDLQKSLSEIEDQLQLARRYYNGTVRNYNITKQSFPTNMVAAIFNFQDEKFFRVDYATERKAPDVDFQ